MENRCVCCGNIIPEGRQVCPNCEEQQKTGQEQDNKKTDFKSETGDGK